MKKYIFVSFIVVLFVKMSAQHYSCSALKSRFVNIKKANRSTTSYIAPESFYDLKFYHLNLNIERNSTFISGHVLSKAKVVVASLDTFAFLLHLNYSIDSVYVNGAKRNFIRKDSLVKATTGLPILNNTLFDAIVYYNGTAPADGGSAIGNGYSTGKSNWNNEVSWSLSESFVAYQWFPCKQDLTDKIDSSWVFATTDSTNLVGSNGLLTNVVKVGSKKRFEWKSHKPIAYYLISVATANYKQYNLYAHPQYLAPDSLFIQNFVYDAVTIAPDWNTRKARIDLTVPLIEMQSKLFGMYPFYKEKYGHSMAPFGGGMEHQTMTSLIDFNFGLIAHELGHQWWGDNVTCSSWKDIFMNEGWATYAAYLCREYLPTLSNTPAAAEMVNIHNDVMSQPGGSSYISNADTTNTGVIFNGRLTYNKGAAIIHSLRYEINNDSVFFPAIRAFQKTYQNGVASVIDFRNFMGTFSGKNFTQFFNQWYYGQGYPTFDVKYGTLSNVLYIKSSQSQSMPSATPLFVTHVDYRVSRSFLPDTTLRLMHNQAVENYTFALSGNITKIVVDPDNWILNNVIGPVKDNSIIGIGLQEFEIASIFIGPNPTSDLLSISANTGDKFKVEITDITGKQILSQSFENQIDFDVSKYANGIYTVILKDSHNKIVKTTKVVKN